MVNCRPSIFQLFTVISIVIALICHAIHLGATQAFSAQLVAVNDEQRAALKQKPLYTRPVSAVPIASIFLILVYVLLIQLACFAKKSGIQVAQLILLLLINNFSSFGNVVLLIYSGLFSSTQDSVSYSSSMYFYLAVSSSPNAYYKEIVCAPDLVRNMSTEKKNICDVNDIVINSSYALAFFVGLSFFLYFGRLREIGRQEAGQNQTNQTAAPAQTKPKNAPPSYAMSASNSKRV
jgi:hypothetical protein